MAKRNVVTVDNDGWKEDQIEDGCEHQAVHQGRWELKLTIYDIGDPNKLETPNVRQLPKLIPVNVCMYCGMVFIDDYQTEADFGFTKNYRVDEIPIDRSPDRTAEIVVSQWGPLEILAELQRLDDEIKRLTALVEPVE